MKLIFSLGIFFYALFEASGYPYHSSSGNVDTWTFPDANRGSMVLSRSRDPYQYRRVVRGGPTTYMLRQPEVELARQLTSQYHLADRRRQALLEVNDTPPQQNEVYYPQIPEIPSVVPIEATELSEPLETTEVVPTTKAVIVPESIEPEIEEDPEEPVPKPKIAVPKKKQTTRPVDDDDDEDESYPSYPKFPTGAYFPMFFGWGGGSGSSGPTAIANAFSTGRGGVSASDATAYESPRPQQRE